MERSRSWHFFGGGYRWDFDHDQDWRESVGGKVSKRSKTIQKGRSTETTIRKNSFAAVQSWKGNAGRPVREGKQNNCDKSMLSKKNRVQASTSAGYSYRIGVEKRRERSIKLAGNAATWPGRPLFGGRITDRTSGKRELATEGGGNRVRNGKCVLRWYA